MFTTSYLFPRGPLVYQVCFVCSKLQSEGGHNIFDFHEHLFQEFRVHPPGIGADRSLYIVYIGRNEFSARINAVVKGFDIDHKEYRRKG